MSTNYYYRETRNSEKKHVGKRWAAGSYCWDCKLPVEGPGDCPRCGEKRVKDYDLHKEKKGVTGVCGFCWAVHPAELISVPYFENEYGEVMTGDEFWKMVSICPIQHYDSIGKEFS